MTTRGRAAVSGRWVVAASALGLVSVSPAHADPELVKAAYTSGVAVDGRMLLSPEFLEAQDAVIGDIRIRSGDVFDTSNPEEDGVFYRVINALHIETRDDVIRRQLLVESGDPYSADSVAEAERMLRTNNYLQSAEIVPVELTNGKVDLEVITEDTWSLKPSISFARKGGANTGGFEFEETNLLGTGSEIKLGYKSRLERDETYFGYHDGQLGESRFALSLGLADNSDGSAYNLLLQQPFYALDARRAGGIFVDSFDQVDPLYQLGDVYDEIRHASDRMEVFYGWSKGLTRDHVSRWTVGLGYDRQQFTPGDERPYPGPVPADRRDVYPFVGYEWLQNRYEETFNADNIQRVEDRYTGTRVAGRLGYASQALGADENAWLYSLEAQTGYKVRGDDTLLLFGGVSGRQAAQADNRYRAEAGARYYHRQSRKRLLYLEVLAAGGQALDPNEQLALGGDSGLRGYPARYQAGDRQALVTLEQRFYTDWYPFRLFHVGAAAFADAGRAWNTSGPAGSDLGWLRDVGVGLRIGSPRSSTGRMLHIDVAWPLDGPDDLRGAQFTVETSRSF